MQMGNEEINRYCVMKKEGKNGKIERKRNSLYRNLTVPQSTPNIIHSYD